MTRHGHVDSRPLTHRQIVQLPTAAPPARLDGMWCQFERALVSYEPRFHMVPCHWCTSSEHPACVCPQTRVETGLGKGRVREVWFEERRPDRT